MIRLDGGIVVVVVFMEEGGWWMTYSNVRFFAGDVKVCGPGVKRLVDIDIAEITMFDVEDGMIEGCDVTGQRSIYSRMKSRGEKYEVRKVEDLWMV